MWTLSRPRCVGWLAIAATVAAATTLSTDAQARGIVIVPVIRPGYYDPPPPPVYVYPSPYLYAYPPPLPVAYVAPPSSAPPPPDCREYQTDTTIAGRTQPAYGTACLQPDGSWRIVR